MSFWSFLYLCLLFTCVFSCEEGYTNNYGICEPNKCNNEYECPSHFAKTLCIDNVCGCRSTLIWNSTLTARNEKDVCQCPLNTQLVWTHEYPYPRCIQKKGCYERYHCTQQKLLYNYGHISCIKQIIAGAQEKEVEGICTCNYGYVDENNICVCKSPRKESYSSKIEGTVCLNKGECISIEDCPNNRPCQTINGIGKCI